MSSSTSQSGQGCKFRIAPGICIQAGTIADRSQHCDKCKYTLPSVLEAKLRAVQHRTSQETLEIWRNGIVWDQGTLGWNGYACVSRQSKYRLVGLMNPPVSRSITDELLKARKAEAGHWDDYLPCISAKRLGRADQLCDQCIGAKNEYGSDQLKACFITQDDGLNGKTLLGSVVAEANRRAEQERLEQMRRLGA